MAVCNHVAVEFAIGLSRSENPFLLALGAQVLSSTIGQEPRQNRSGSQTEPVGSGFPISPIFGVLAVRLFHLR
jgi:hypothetical protein